MPPLTESTNISSLNLSYTLFRSSILKFIKPSPNSFYGCQNIIGMQLVTRLHQGLSHLREHQFKHIFQDTLNPLCNCTMDVEFFTHFLLQCPSYINKRCTLMSNLNRINPQISQVFLQLLTNTLLFGNSSLVTKRIRIFLTLVLFFKSGSSKINSVIVKLKWSGYPLYDMSSLNVSSPIK